jgi:ribosome-associated toxin RatA of RatAB toxin-antitoxin module
MSDASQDVPEAPGAIATQLSQAIEKMLGNWAIGQDAAKITLHMTYEQWSDLLNTLRAAEGREG